MKGKSHIQLGAIMPNGERYDGRFHLPQDIRIAEERGFDMNNPASASAFYNVPVEIYRRGQKMASEAVIETNDEIHRPEDWLSAYIKPQPTSQDTSSSALCHSASPVRELAYLTITVLFGAALLRGFIAILSSRRRRSAP